LFNSKVNVQKLGFNIPLMFIYTKKHVMLALHSAIASNETYLLKLKNWSKILFLARHN